MQLGLKFHPFKQAQVSTDCLSYEKRIMVEVFSFFYVDIDVVIYTFFKSKQVKCQCLSIVKIWLFANFCKWDETCGNSFFQEVL